MFFPIFRGKKKKANENHARFSEKFSTENSFLIRTSSSRRIAHAFRSSTDTPRASASSLGKANRPNKKYSKFGVIFDLFRKNSHFLSRRNNPSSILKKTTDPSLGVIVGTSVA